MNKRLKTLIIGALALAGAWCASADPVGVTVNGMDVGAEAGDGWTFASGILSLTNAQEYVLAGTNTAGAVRVAVTANATVTLRDLKLVGNSYVEGQIEITKNAHLVLEGVNTVYSPVHLASIILKKGCSLTLEGSGELVGDPTTTDTQYSQRALWIVGTLVINGGTIRDYKNPIENGAGVFIENGEYLFTMNGGVITNCHAVSGVGGGVYSKGPFTMNGGLIVDCRSGSNGGGVYNNGRTFTMNGGTIKNCRSEGNGGAVNSVGTFTMNGGTIIGNAGMSGGALFNTGTARIYGGTFQDNMTTGDSGSYAGAIFDDHNSHTYIYGGYFSGNKNKKADNGTNLYSGYCWQKNGSLYGGVFDANPTDFSESHDCLLLQGGAAVTTVGDLYVVGKRVTEEDACLTGGTYTFCPTNAEYAAAGLEIADDRVIHAADTTPKTYAIGGEPTGVTVNGMDVGAEAGDGWAFAGGILSLTNAQEYVLAGTNTAGAVRVEVTANATITLDNLTLQGYLSSWNYVDGYIVFASSATDARIVLVGDNRLFSDKVLASADLKVGSKVTLSGDGAFVGGRSVSSTKVNCRCFWLHGASLVMEGGTIRDYYHYNEAGVGVICGPDISSSSLSSFTMNGGAIKDCESGYGNGAAVNIVNGTSHFNRGLISGCSTPMRGSAVYVGSGETAEIRSGMVFSGNKTTKGACVIYAFSGTINVWGGTFRDNVVGNDGVFSGDTGVAGEVNVYGGVVTGCSQSPVTNSAATVFGGEFDVAPYAKRIASGYAATKVGSLYVVGKGVSQANDLLTGGTYTFCPTNAEYVAEGVAIADGTSLTENATTPVTWTIGLTITYPDYLGPWSAAVTNKFDVWAETYGSRDPDGVYTNAFLLNVATNNEVAAVAAFKIESLAVTNDVVDITVAKPIDSAPMYNGIAWLQCVTNDLSKADWLDIEDGRYTEGDRSFFTLRIDFEHKVTPEAFPKNPEGSRTMRVYQH